LTTSPILELKTISPAFGSGGVLRRAAIEITDDSVTTASRTDRVTFVKAALWPARNFERGETDDSARHATVGMRGSSPRVTDGVSPERF
jgi:hypothetical protein